MDFLLNLMIGSIFGTFGEQDFKWNFDYGPLQGVKNRIEILNFILEFDDFLGGLKDKNPIENSAFEKSLRGAPRIPRMPTKRSHRPQDGARETRARFPDDARWQRQTPSKDI